MRARTLLLTLFLLALLPAGTAAAASKFTIRGAGFGHGVGMSQYGAYGFALNGSAYRDILAHYYTGTAIGAVDGSKRVRVLLQSTRGAASFTGAVRAGRRRLSSRKTYYVRRSGGRVQLRSARGKRMGTYTALRVKGRRGVVTLRGRAANGRVNGAYRGAIDFSPGAFSGVDAINSLSLDTYLRGVVPDESPPSWPLEALKAQAVAARTYAIATMKPGAGFDLYPDTRSQVYGGVAAEEASTNQAIAETSGEVVTYNGAPVVTFFFSTSGGRTEDVENTPLGNEPQPWLKSVDDPYDDASPRHRWGPIRMSMKRADAKLGSLVKGKFRGIEVLRRGKSPRIVEAEVIGSRGRTLVTGGQLRARLGLFDTWAFFTSISTGEEPPEEPEGPPTGGTEPFGSAAWLRAHAIAQLSGRVLPVLDSGVANVQRRVGGRWVDVGVARVRRGGRYRYPVTEPGRYRIRYHDENGPAITVLCLYSPAKPADVLRLRGVIFDCDGVLVDSEAISNRVLAGLLTEIGLPLTPEQSIEAFLGRSWKTIQAWAAERGTTITEEFRLQYREAMFAAFEQELAPVPGVVDALDSISLPACVASSGSHEKVRFTLGHTGLLERFDGRIFSSTEVEHGKPAPDLFLHAADSMGWDPATTAVVEDSPAGVAGGLAAGMTVFGYAGVTPADRLDGARVFTDMADLPDLLTQPS